MTEAGIRPRSLTCIPCSRAQARTASDWPGGATFVTAPAAPSCLRVARAGRLATGAEDVFVVAVFLLAVFLLAVFLLAVFLVGVFLVAVFLVAVFLAAGLLVAGPRRVVDFDADA